MRRQRSQDGLRAYGQHLFIFLFLFYSAFLFREYDSVHLHLRESAMFSLFKTPNTRWKSVVPRSKS